MVAKLSITGELQPLSGQRGGECESKEAGSPNYAPPEASACPLRNFKYRHKERLHYRFLGGCGRPPAPTAPVRSSRLASDVICPYTPQVAPSRALATPEHGHGGICFQ